MFFNLEKSLWLFNEFLYSSLSLKKQTKSSLLVSTGATYEYLNTSYTFVNISIAFIKQFLT